MAVKNFSTTKRGRSSSRGRSLSRGRSWSRKRVDKEKQNQPEQQQSPKKLLNVTVTILSLNGVRAKETAKSIFTKQKPSDKTSDLASPSTTNRGRSLSRRRSPSRGRSKSWGRSLSRSRSLSRGQNKDTRGRGRSAKIAPFDAAEEENNTTLVASFGRISVTKKGGPSKKITHISSQPLELPDESTFDDVVYWPDESKSFKFQRHFPYEQENMKLSRYAPQLCPIQLSISRNGKMYKLGRAEVYLSGEENGQASMNVPVVNVSNSGGGGSGSVSFRKLKGDTLKCGLAERATLRVLVKVDEPSTVSWGAIRKAVSSDEQDVIRERSFLQYICCQ